MGTATLRLWKLASARFAGRYRELLRTEIVGSCHTLLDLGCGRASPVGDLKDELTRSVGIDLDAGSVAESRSAGLHHEYECADVLGVLDRFGPDSFDCVTALDLIEHLPKTDGWRLLEVMEGVARRKVIVFTPNGFLPQSQYDDNALQEHLSGWSPAEFEERGYRVYGVHGWKPLRGERMRVVWRPRLLWELVSLWSQPLVEGRPGAAFQMLCVKDLTGEPDPATDGRG